MSDSTGCTVSVLSSFAICFRHWHWQRWLAAKPFHQATLGGAHSTVNGRDRQLGFSCDLFDSPTFSAAQPQAASLLVRQSLQKSEQQPHVHLKVRRCFE